MSEYVLDELVWYTAAPIVMDLPIHIDHPGLSFVPQPLLSKEASLDDVLGVLDDVSGRWVDAYSPVRLDAHDGERALQGFLVTSHVGLLYRATAPGPPGTGQRAFLVLRVLAPERRAWARTIWSWNDAIQRVAVKANENVTTVDQRDGTRDRHMLTVGGWRIVRSVGGMRTATELAGLAPRMSAASVDRVPVRTSRSYTLERGRALTFDLGEADYRRSEESWDEAGRPTARVCVLLTEDELVVDARMKKEGELTSVSGAADNPYDNESADVNGDGIQLYLLDRSGPSAWMLVPELDDADEGSVRARVIDDWSSPRALRGRWQRQPDGYSMRIRLRAPDISAAEPQFALGLVVNEMPAMRTRRRGQLLLGGAHGEFVYLRGDREERDRLLRFSVLG
jgi:hypothetical protein